MTAPRSPQPDPTTVLCRGCTTFTSGALYFHPDCPVHGPAAVAAGMVAGRSPDPSEAAVTEGPLTPEEAVRQHLRRALPLGAAQAEQIAADVVMAARYPHLRWDLDEDHETDEHRRLRRPSAPERPDLTALIAETERDHGPRGGYFENSGYCRRCDEALPCLAMRFRAALRAEQVERPDESEPLFRAATMETDADPPAAPPRPVAGSGHTDHPGRSARDTVADRRSEVERPSLDVAWAEAEAALPRGWGIDELDDDSSPPLRNTRWTARAASPYIVLASGESIESLIDIAKERRLSPDSVISMHEEYGGGAAAYESVRIEASGPTPAAALGALAARLSSSESARHG